MRQREVSTHLENIHNKNIWINHTEWQVNEVQLQVLQGSRERKSEAAGDRNDFSMIMDPAGHTLLAICLCNYIEVSPPKSIQNFSHLKCSMVGKEV